MRLSSGALLSEAVRPDAEAVAVLLHGASAGGSASTSWYAPVPLRMQLFAPSISMGSGGRIQVIRLRHPDRDWRQLFRGALGDTAELLAEITRIAPHARIGLVGHSNGGRVALRLSSDSRVDAVAALAPWIVPSDRIVARPGQPVLLMHGDYDRITDPMATRALADRLRQRDVRVDVETLADTHALLLRSWYWHRRVARFLREHLLS